MKRYSKKSFAQVMINKLLKGKLDELKNTIGKEIEATWNLSYCDVITHLVKNYKPTEKFETSIEPKLLTKFSFSEAKLRVTKKLDGKQRVSYFLES